jgi:hypothetical protein
MTRLSEPFVPLTSNALVAQTFNSVELDIAPTVVFRELNAAGQLVALAHKDEARTIEAVSSITKY